MRLPCAVHIVSRSFSHCGRCKPQSHGPSGRCRRSARQEQSARRSLRESCSHEARGQACCQIVRAISTLERADNLFAGTDTPFAETRTRSPRRKADDCSQYSTIRRATQKLSSFGRIRPDDLLNAHARKRKQCKLVLLKMPAACLGLLSPETKRSNQSTPV